MSPPTNLPSAADLANSCANDYTLLTGPTLDQETQTNLEALAKHFLETNTFRDLLKLIPWKRFSHSPNHAHTAIADLLCCGAAYFVATTNYDTHIEDAALRLGERDFRSSLDGVEAAESADSHRPLLKLHGCHRRDRNNTLWTHSQILENKTIKERQERTVPWLVGNLTGKDVVLVGFWTDWDYLNDILSSAVAGSEPRTIVLVDPSDSKTLEEKAPDLWTWANQPNATFILIQEQAHLFLEELRTEFSRRFLHRVFDGAETLFGQLFPGEYPIDDSAFVSLRADDLYPIRKDLAGRTNSEACREAKPIESMQLAAAFMAAILSSGGKLHGSVFSLNGKYIRVINCANLLLSQAKDRYQGDLAHSPRCDTAICVGAFDASVPEDVVVRSPKTQSIVRNDWAGRWLTNDDAREWICS